MIYLNAFDQADDIHPGILYTDISDHLPVFILKFGKHPKKFHKKISKRIFSSQSEDEFHHDISQADWSSIYKSKDPNAQYDYLINTISKLYDKHFPIKNVRVHPSTIKKTWITPGILRSIRRKNKLYRLKLKTPTAKNIAKFRNYRNKLNHLIRTAKISFIRQC